MLRAIASEHKVGDSGHEEWYLQDLERLGFPQPRADELFSDTHAAARIALFQLVAIVYGSTSDLDRIVFLYVLEGAGHVFFRRTAKALSSLNRLRGLRYFGKSHLDAELDHGMFKTDAEGKDEKPWESALEPGDLTSAEMVVKRVFTAFEEMFSGIYERASRPR